jgi:serine/threonine protein kinase
LYVVDGYAPPARLSLLTSFSGDLKIADFGFSRKVDSDGSLCSTFVGSPAYCAPEIHANVAYSGTAADVWSLGAGDNFYKLHMRIFTPNLAHLALSALHPRRQLDMNGGS